MEARESVKSPKSMFSVHRSTEVATDASNAVGAEVSSSEGATTIVDGMMNLETDSGGCTTKMTFKLLLREGPILFQTFYQN